MDPVIERFRANDRRWKFEGGEDAECPGCGGLIHRQHGGGWWRCDACPMAWKPSNRAICRAEEIASRAIEAEREACGGCPNCPPDPSIRVSVEYFHHGHRAGLTNHGARIG